jgi:hypothetical protein
MDLASINAGRFPVQTCQKIKKSSSCLTNGVYAPFFVVMNFLVQTYMWI